MNTPWIIWLLAIVISFTILEAYAFNHPARENTLSRFIWSVGQKWPLSIFLFGGLCFSLATHFYWNWCPLIMPPGVGG